MTTLRDRAKEIQRELHALYLAIRDPRVPPYAKGVAIAAVGYALSPIDLIPDFIPVLGHLDDLIIVPILIRLAIRLIPADIWSELKAQAQAAEIPDSRARWYAAAAIVVAWIVCALLLYRVAVRHFR